MNLRGEWSMLKQGIKIWSAYRFEFLVMLVSTPLSLFIYYYLWKSIYAYMGSDLIGGYAFNQMIQYYVLSMMVGFFTWSEVDKWIENDLIHGYMIKGFLKPLPIISWYMTFEAGINIMNILTLMLPIFGISFFLFGLKIISAFNAISFIISLLFAFFIYFGLTYLLGLSAFWLKRIAGLRRVRRVIFGFFSGSLLPLTLFPEWTQNIMHYLPFEHMKFVPINIYLGTITRAAVIKALALQLAWVIIIFILIKIVWTQAYKRFASVGL